MWLIPYYRDWDSNRSIQKSRLVHEVCFLSGVSGFPGDIVLNIAGWVIRKMINLMTAWSIVKEISEMVVYFA